MASVSWSSCFHPKSASSSSSSSSSSSCCQPRFYKDWLHLMTADTHVAFCCETDCHESVIMYLSFRFLLTLSLNQRQRRPLCYDQKSIQSKGSAFVVCLLPSSRGGSFLTEYISQKTALFYQLSPFFTFSFQDYLMIKRRYRNFTPVVFSMALPWFGTVG